MSLRLDVRIDKSGISALATGPMKRAVVRALRKAGMSALRDMRSEARKRITARKRISGKYISRAITLSKPKGADISTMSWAVRVSGEPIPLIAYPHSVSKRGLTVEVNRGKRTLVKGAFVATMASGHEGIFKRVGKARLPIKELRGSRPVDALLHQGEAQGVADRGATSFAATFKRVLPMEIGK